MKSKILNLQILTFFLVILVLLAIFFILSPFVEAAKSVFRQPPVGTIVVYKVAGLPPYNQGTQIRFAEVGARGLTTSPKVLAQSQFSGLTLSEISAVRRGKNIDIVYEIENVVSSSFNYPTIALKHRRYDESMSTFVEQNLPLPQGYLLRDLSAVVGPNNNLYVVTSGHTGINQPSEIKLYSINSSNNLIASSTIHTLTPPESIGIFKSAIDPSTGNIHIIANVHGLNGSYGCSRKIFVFDPITFNQIQTIVFPLCSAVISELQIGPQGDGVVILPNAGGDITASYLDPTTGQWSSPVSLPLPQLTGWSAFGTYLFPGSNSPTNSITLATTEYSSTTPPDIEFKLRLSHDTGRTFLNSPVSIFANVSSSNYSHQEFYLARFKERPNDLPFVLGRASNELRIFHDPGFLGQITEYVVDQVSGTQYIGDVSVVEF